MNPLVVRERAAAYGAPVEEILAGGDPADPVDPADAADELGDRIVTLAGHIHAGTYELLVLLAQYDRTRRWEAAGHRSCAYWLAYRTGFDLGTAREHVRVARALERLPETGRSMGRGELSFSKVRALSRVASQETETDLLEAARGCTAAQLERLVRAWKLGSRHDEAAAEQALHGSRHLSVFPDDDGMYVVTGLVEPEVGVVLQRSIEAGTDALYRERGLERAYRGTRAGEREAARRRADAIGLVAERALAAGFGLEGEDDGEPREPCSCGRAPISGTRAERYQVVLLVEPETLTADGEPGRSELEDGTRVSAETSRRLACDAGLVRVTVAADPANGSNGGSGDGSHDSSTGRSHNGSNNVHGPTVLDVGRRTRTIPPALRRALEVRDRGCRFPGCGLRFTDAHHVVHWGDGGETSLANTLLLCRYHHRLVHEDGWRIEWWGVGQPAFRDPRTAAIIRAPGSS
jgi:hypothetical protein